MQKKILSFILAFFIGSTSAVALADPVADMLRQAQKQTNWGLGNVLTSMGCLSGAVVRDGCIGGGNADQLNDPHNAITGYRRNWSRLDSILWELPSLTAAEVVEKLLGDYPGEPEMNRDWYFAMVYPIEPLYQHWDGDIPGLAGNEHVIVRMGKATTHAAQAWRYWSDAVFHAGKAWRADAEPIPPETEQALRDEALGHLGMTNNLRHYVHSAEYHMGKLVEAHPDDPDIQIASQAMQESCDACHRVVGLLDGTEPSTQPAYDAWYAMLWPDPSSLREKSRLITLHVGQWANKQDEANMPHQSALHAGEVIARWGQLWELADRAAYPMAKLMVLENQ